MTIKRKRIYEIIIISLVIILTSLCAYMGIMAVQKSMSLKLQFSEKPAVSCSFRIRESNSTGNFTNVFKNYDNAEIGSGVSLSQNTLIFESDKCGALTGSAIDLEFTNKTTECSAIKLSVQNATVDGVAGYSVIIPEDGTQVIENISCPAGTDVVFKMEYVAEISFTLQYATITSVSSDLTLKENNTYYAVYGVTPTVTLAATDNHMNPPQNVTISNNAGSYSNGTITFNAISQDVSVDVANTNMQTYILLKEESGTTISTTQTPTHGQDFSFTVKVTDETFDVLSVSYKIGSGGYVLLSTPTPSGDAYEFTIDGVNITGDVTIKAKTLHAGQLNINFTFSGATNYASSENYFIVVITNDPGFDMTFDFSSSVYAQTYAIWKSSYDSKYYSHAQAFSNGTGTSYTKKGVKELIPESYTTWDYQEWTTDYSNVNDQQQTFDVIPGYKVYIYASQPAGYTGFMYMDSITTDDVAYTTESNSSGRYYGLEFEFPETPVVININGFYYEYESNGESEPWG